MSFQSCKNHNVTKSKCSISKFTHFCHFDIVSQTSMSYIYIYREASRQVMIFPKFEL